jgi:hypothetical protein
MVDFNDRHASTERMIRNGADHDRPIPAPNHSSRRPGIWLGRSSCRLAPGRSSARTPFVLRWCEEDLGPLSLLRGGLSRRSRKRPRLQLESVRGRRARARVCTGPMDLQGGQVVDPVLYFRRG